MTRSVAGIVSLALTGAAGAAAPDALSAAVTAFADGPVNFKYALRDLNSDGRLDAIVLLNDNTYCGSGGCTLLVFRGTDGGYSLVSSSTITREPIGVLPQTSHGWRSLTVTVAGGGIIHGFTALMTFDGKRYPGNPSMQPHAPQVGNVLQLQPAAPNRSLEGSRGR